MLGGCHQIMMDTIKKLMGDRMIDSDGKCYGKRDSLGCCSKRRLLF